MQIQLNGEPFELPDAQSVADLLARLELGGRRVAVELNLISCRAASTPAPRSRMATAWRSSTPSAAARPGPEPFHRPRKPFHPGVIR